nr:von Willebrand factor type A domain-containing protein [candidate division Zixibacteria bacterium]
MKTGIIVSGMALMAVIALLPIIISAGPTAKITGIITDHETGNPIQGVTMTIMETGDRTITDSRGMYLINFVAPGYYTIRFTSSSYHTIQVDSVRVSAGLVTTLSLKMEKAADESAGVIRMTANGDIVERPALPDSQMSFEEIITTSNDWLLRQSEAKKNAVGNIANYSGLVPIAPCPADKGRTCNPWGSYGPAHGGTAIVNGEPFDAMFFKDYGTNPFVDTEDDHLSTFAIDVDDASYIMTRSYLERGELPPDEAIRTEEFINHFKYNYESPREEQFSINIDGSGSYFGQNCELLRIGIKGREINPENRKPANLVFVIDISGSMAREDRLGLVKKALRILVDNLESRDRVGIVVYGSSGRVVLEPTSIHDKNQILSAIEWLQTDGATNAEEGIHLGYEMAEKYFEPEKINRIILCSDGVANVGTTGPDEILKQIKRFADKGITLTTVGFGMGNFNDILMEKLGDKGNGHYAYVDDIAEARRIFMENLTGTLQVIARDVKIQVDFDPAVVRSYRLIGYENRDVADDKFRDDKEDGGEIGSGHQVTALYEIKLNPQKSRLPLGTVFIRYKEPDAEIVHEVSRKIDRALFLKEFEQQSANFRLAAAAAEFAEILGKSYWARDSKLETVYQMVQGIFEENQSVEIVDLMNLITKTQKLQDHLAEK